jgi:hypothetical protein
MTLLSRKPKAVKPAKPATKKVVKAKAPAKGKVLSHREVMKDP